MKAHPMAYLADLLIANVLGPLLFFGIGWLMGMAANCVSSAADRLIAVSRDRGRHGRPV